MTQRNLAKHPKRDGRTPLGVSPNAVRYRAYVVPAIGTPIGTHGDSIIAEWTMGQSDGLKMFYRAANTATRAANSISGYYIRSRPGTPADLLLYRPNGAAGFSIVAAANGVLEYAPDGGSRIRLEVFENRHIIYVNGVQVIDYSDAMYRAQNEWSLYSPNLGAYFKLWDVQRRRTL